MNKIDNFLNNYNSKNTIKLNRCALNQFFKIIGKNPDDYIKKGQTYEEDIKKFQKEIYDKAPRTISNYLGAVKQFLEEYDVELKNSFWRKLKSRGKGNKPITQDIIPTLAEIKRMLSHSNLMERTVILMLLSSGMRIGELLSLEKKHINLSSTPTVINIPSSISKNKRSRITFISKEATDYLKEWIIVRDKYITNTFRKVNFPNVSTTPLDKNTIFPIEYETFRRRFLLIINKTQLEQRDVETNRHKIHLHSFRKYFRTHLGTVLPIDIIEELIGHDGYLSRSYVRHTEDELREYYLESEYKLLVFENQADTTDLKKQVMDLETKVKTLSLALYKLSPTIATLPKELINDLL